MCDKAYGKGIEKLMHSTGEGGGHCLQSGQVYRPSAGAQGALLKRSLAPQALCAEPLSPPLVQMLPVGLWQN